MECPEERDRRRKQEIVGEERSPDTTNRCEDDEGHDELFLPRVEARRDELPDLIHDEWRREHDAADESDIQIEREPFTRLREDQRVARRQRRESWSEDEVAEPVIEEEGDQHASGDRDTRTDDTCPELVKMLQESHPAIAMIIGVLRQRLRIGFGHIASLKFRSWALSFRLCERDRFATYPF